MELAIERQVLGVELAGAGFGYRAELGLVDVDEAEIFHEASSIGRAVTGAP